MLYYLTYPYHSCYLIAILNPIINSKDSVYDKYKYISIILLAEYVSPSKSEIQAVFMIYQTYVKIFLASNDTLFYI